MSYNKNIASRNKNYGYFDNYNQNTMNDTDSNLDFENLKDNVSNAYEQISDTLSNVYQIAKNEVSKLLSPSKKNYDRQKVINAVSRATSSDQSTINNIISQIYGNQKTFTDQDIANIVDITIYRNNAKIYGQSIDSLDQSSENNHLYSANEMREIVGNKLGIIPSQIDLSNQNEKYTERDIQKILSQFGKPQNKSMNQSGGYLSTWDQNDGENISAMKDSFVSQINHMMQHGLTLHQGLGSDEEIISDDNKKKLFEHLYYLYPQLKNNSQTKNIFEDADDNNAYLWSEIGNEKFMQVIEYIVRKTLDYYQNKVEGDVEQSKSLQRVFTQN